MNHVNIAIAFIAGLVSFLSPCVLPLVPSYLAQLVGPGLAQSQRQDTTLTASEQPTDQRFAPLFHSLAFVGGFSLMFIALGASASVLGTFLRTHQLAIARIGGALLVVMGLHFAGILKIPFFYREGRIQWRPAQRGYPSSFLIGIIFAAGWSPCIGVILTSILLLAEQSSTLASGVVLLAAYALGLGLPFIAMGAAFTRVSGLLRRLAPHTGTIERVTGIIIAVMGVVIFSGWLIYLNQYFTFGGI